MLKPQDILILLKKITTRGKDLSGKELSEELGMSASAVSESLERCLQSQLVDRNKKRVNALALEEFLIHGIAYVFPVQAGRVGRGVPTYVSASPLKEKLASGSDEYVWHHIRGNARGQQIEPLYPSVPEAAQKDEELYELLVIVDALRMGRAREKEIAINELKKYIALYGEK